MALLIEVALAVGVAAFMLGAHGERRRLLGQAMTDPLTGAFNRRQMDCCLRTTIERRNRMGEPASLLLFDVDHFKRINDACGHAAGDEALRGLVALVSARARQLDMLFRIGGEEFVLLLPGARSAGALAVAEHLRASVAAADLLYGRRISISIGVSELKRGQSIAGWMADADAAVYRAKQSGRNRVSLSGRRSLPPLAMTAHG
jgi:diguanylate cyclase (GGDEF)-like protein